MTVDNLGAECVSCSRFQTPLFGGKERSCTAFPNGTIPDDIWNLEFDHRKPHTGDHDLQWKSLGGYEFPEWAMKEQAKK